MSKYIDLKEQIVEDSGTISPRVKIGIEEALDWLDEHPDQTPGRTITQSRYAAEGRDRSLTYMRGFDAALIELGARVVSDSEPTNAELVELKLRELREEPGEWMTYATDSDISGFSQALDAKGVKASGFDDDH